MQKAFGLRTYTFAAGFVFAMLMFVSPAHADTAVAVSQILPQGAQTCPVLGATDITPYIYDGMLDSFDITISDASYVAVAAQVGDTAVPFTQMTRWFDQQTGMRIHADLPSTNLASDLPITVTLVSAHAGNTPITCVAMLRAVVPAIVPAQPTPSTPVTTGTSQTPSATTAQYPWSHISYPTPSVTPHTKPSNTGTSAPQLVTATHALGTTCGTQNGPTKLWVVLCVLYAVFVWLLASQAGLGDKESRDWNVALVVAGFLALLFFWYISAACRTGSWAPILATVIACAGLIALTQSGGKGASILLLRDSQH
jgi:hypothetical protein